MSLRYAIVLPLLLLSGAAYGRGCKTMINADELPLLPKYCQVKCEYGINRNNPEVKRWIDIFGWNNYLHVHHYCFALNFEHRAVLAPNKIQRNYAYQEAVRNYDYVLKHWQAGFALIPEAHVRKGLDLEKMGQSGAAAQEYQAAIRANPKYPAGYAALSDWYKRYGSKKDAVATLEKGLKQIPKSRVLRRRLARLK